MSGRLQTYADGNIMDFMQKVTNTCRNVQVLIVNTGTNIYQTSFHDIHGNHVMGFCRTVLTDVLKKAKEDWNERQLPLLVIVVEDLNYQVGLFQPTEVQAIDECFVELALANQG